MPDDEDRITEAVIGLMNAAESCVEGLRHHNYTDLQIVEAVLRAHYSKGSDVSAVIKSTLDLIAYMEMHPESK